MTRSMLAIACLATVVTMLVADAVHANEPLPAATDAAGKADAPACLRARRIVGWLRLDDHAVVLRTQSQKFKVTFVGPCRATYRAYGVGVRSFGACVRAGDTAVFTPSFGMDPTCMIDTVTLLPKDWTRPPKAEPPKQ